MLAALLLSFAVIFVAELGDKSQLMAMMFALRYRWWVVLSAITAATVAVHLLSVAIGSLAAAHSLRTALAGDVRQPGTILRTYRQPGSRGMTQLAARLAGDIPALTAPPEPAILRP